MRFILWLLVAAFGSSIGIGQVFQPIGDLSGGTFSSLAKAVSDDGSTVVGSSNGTAGSQAILWRPDSGMVSLGVIGQAEDVSANGDVIVGEKHGVLVLEAFRWTARTGAVGLGGLPGGSWSWATSVSDNGNVIAGHAEGNGARQGFRWTEKSGMQPLGFLPILNPYPDSLIFGMSKQGSVLVGQSNFQAMQWQERTGQIAILPNGIAYSVSADGKTAVGEFTFGGRQVAFRWSLRAGAQSLGFLGALPTGQMSSAAFSANRDGSVIVGTSTTPSGFEAFIWDELQGMRNLRNVLQAAGVDLTGWTLIAANDISANGSFVVGEGRNPHGLNEGWFVDLSPHGRRHSP